MDRDDQELTAHLFAKATALLEAAHEIAAQGQQAHLSADELVGLVEELSRAAEDVAAIVRAAAIAVQTRPNMGNSPLSDT